MAAKTKLNNGEKYTKRAFYNSRAYSERQDLVLALLEDGKTYTMKEVDKIIDDFLQKGAK